MPQFTWRGFTILGVKKRGTMFASSSQHLDELLLRRGIACMFSKQKRKPFIVSPITRADQVQLFRQLGALLKAGILLPDAFSLVSQQIAHSTLQEYVHAVAQRLKEGQVLHDALTAQCPFSSFVIRVLHVGYQSGDLVRALAAVTDYIESQRVFYAQLRAVLMMPLITLCFVGVLLWGMFALLLPSITGVFSSFDKELPSTTQFLLHISAFVRSWFFGLALIGLVCVGISIWLIVTRTRVRYWWDYMVLHSPFIGTAYKQHIIVICMRSLSSLLSSGMRLHPALELLHTTQRNMIVRADCAHLMNEVASGSTLSDALASLESGIFNQDVVAMVYVGEESNTLVFMLEAVADIYYERFTRLLSRFALCAQPVLIIFLGLVVTLLIVAMYLPIMQLADVV